MKKQHNEQKIVYSKTESIKGGTVIISADTKFNNIASNKSVIHGNQIILEKGASIENNSSENLSMKTNYSNINNFDQKVKIITIESNCKLNITKPMTLNVVEIIIKALGAIENQSDGAVLIKAADNDFSDSITEQTISNTNLGEI